MSASNIGQPLDRFARPVCMPRRWWRDVPKIYQDTPTRPSQRHRPAARLVDARTAELSEIDAYDASLPLVIDPSFPAQPTWAARDWEP